ncbi:hypothetical protein F5H01DRAFT_342461, partial [Linnemannia elongata]
MEARPRSTVFIYIVPPSAFILMLPCFFFSFRHSHQHADVELSFVLLVFIPAVCFFFFPFAPIRH